VRLEHVGLIGNCQCAALIEHTGAIVWCCLPRFDSEPVFGSLLDPDGGQFLVGPADGSTGTPRYLDNTNILETIFDAPGGRFRVVDFAPRFERNDRVFRPTQIFRIVEPLEGSPRVIVRCDPVRGWSKNRPVATPGSNHIRYEGFANELRLTTTIPARVPRRPALHAHRDVIIWPSPGGTPIEEPLPELGDRFLSETTRHWQRWVKHCDVPPRYQREVIRSALALKLHCYEDTGAIVAAMTTSIPESPASGRNWDYRYCWLRDAYYTIDAFRLLGTLRRARAVCELRLERRRWQFGSVAFAPLLGGGQPRVCPSGWRPGGPGFNGDGPVRIGNGACSARAARHLRRTGAGPWRRCFRTSDSPPNDRPRRWS
jgi:GH15 family glucan-1,4-alpha-glucosidase